MNTNTDRVTLAADELEVKIDYHPRWSTKALAKARVYVDGEEAVDFTEAYALLKANDYAPRGTNPAEDKLFDRLNRQVVKNKRAVIEEALQTFEELDILSGNKLTFSRKAGCGCGCSPAFVPATPVHHDGRWIQSIFISRKKA